MQKLVYHAANAVLLPLIPPGATTILDVGCGNGALARAIRRDRKAMIHGITYAEQEAAEALTVMDEVFVGDLNTFDFAQLGRYDCIICSHVLEHLYRPWETLVALREHFAPDGVLIVAVPNALEVKTRLKFLLGSFRYTDWGILDRTHYRFFDRETAYELVRDAGYRVDVRAERGYCPLPGLRQLLGSRTKKIDDWATRLMPGLLARQLIFRACPR